MLLSSLWRRILHFIKTNAIYSVVLSDVGLFSPLLIYLTQLNKNFIALEKPHHRLTRLKGFSADISLRDPIHPCKH